jgi:predicted transcriptional regulator
MLKQLKKNGKVNLKISASTVLYFPQDATACDEPLSRNKFQPLSYNNHPHLGVLGFYL